MFGKLYFQIICCLVLMIGLPDSTDASDKNFRTVRDSRGVVVKVPEKACRVVTISDGLIEGVMTMLGVQDTLVGTGSACLGQNYRKFSYPLKNGKMFTCENGMNTIVCLNNGITELPQIAAWNSAPNYEKIASLNPDLMMIRVGSCWHWNDNDQVPKSVSMIESLGIPLVVLHSPNTYDKPDIRVMSQEIRIIGKVFGNEPKAEKLANYLEAQVKLVKERTRNIPKEKRPRVLLFGLSSKSKDAGGAGTISGTDTIESFFVEEIVHATNAFQGSGNFKIAGTEQVLALDPDVIILPTAWGYHPPRELYESPHYENLRELRAIRDRRVSALPFTPCNCDKRLEYPIDVMVIAKAAYPELFKDINLPEWLLDFYQNVYGVDRNTAKELRSAQWMNWTLESSANQGVRK